MLNYILLFSVISYIISLWTLFCINWVFCQNDNKSFKTIIKHMRWYEYTPIINVLVLILMISFLGIIFSFLYIMDFIHFIEKIFLRKI
jgi:hypothetical protein